MTELTAKMKKVEKKILRSSSLSSIERHLNYFSLIKLAEHDQLALKQKSYNEIIGILSADTKIYVEAYNSTVNSFKNEKIELIERHLAISKFEDDLVNAYRESKSPEKAIENFEKQTYTPGTAELFMLEIYGFLTILTTILTFVGIVIENLVRNFFNIAVFFSKFNFSEVPELTTTFEVRNYIIFIMMGFLIFGSVAVSIAATKSKKMRKIITVLSLLLIAVYTTAIIVYQGKDFIDSGFFVSNLIMATFSTAFIFFFDFQNLLYQRQSKIDPYAAITKIAAIIGISVFCAAAYLHVDENFYQKVIMCIIITTPITRMLFTVPLEEEKKGGNLNESEN